MFFERCADILARENELVQRAAVLVAITRQAVINKEWAGFESHLGELNAAEKEIACLERLREALFDEWEAAEGQKTKPAPEDAKGRFYALASRLAPEKRSELTAIYRSLKLEALKLRMANETLIGYLSGAMSTLAGFFDAAFPDRGGRIYTKSGAAVFHDMRSMVLNRAF
jgi:hypothetical protein